jgi:hypothetical protein
VIRFDLICLNDHEFDGWFSDNNAFEDQRKQGYVNCPICNSSQIEKQLMAPGIPTKSNQLDPGERAKPMLSAGNNPTMQQLRQQIRQLRDHVTANAEDVGKDFAQTAREIHHEEQPARPIYGQASVDEAKSLLEEGVEVMPLPELPEEKN